MSLININEFDSEKIEISSRMLTNRELKPNNIKFLDET